MFWSLLLLLLLLLVSQLAVLVAAVSLSVSFLVLTLPASAAGLLVLSGPFLLAVHFAKFAVAARKVVDEFAVDLSQNCCSPDGTSLVMISQLEGPFHCGNTVELPLEQVGYSGLGWPCCCRRLRHRCC